MKIKIALAYIALVFCTKKSRYSNELKEKEKYYAYFQVGVCQCSILCDAMLVWCMCDV